jgi:hypothetical protein
MTADALDTHRRERARTNITPYLYRNRETDFRVTERVVVCHF